MTTAPGPPEVVASLGAGTMGAGIALAFARGGSAVTMVSRRTATLEQARRRIETSLDLMIEGGVVRPGDRTAILERIHPTTALDAVPAQADLVVESIAEDLEAKRRLYRAVEPLLGQDTVLASDTSAIPLSELARELRVPERFLGYHWFNPPELVALVEVVPTEKTSTGALDRVEAWSRAIGKEPVRLHREMDGFIANRLQYALMREAYALVDLGVGTTEDIDRAVTAGLGPRWAAVGPLQAMDLAGLDVHRAVAERLFPSLSNETDVPERLTRLTEEGALGLKAGRGLRGTYDE